MNLQNAHYATRYKISKTEYIVIFKEIDKTSQYYNIRKFITTITNNNLNYLQYRNIRENR